MWLLIFFAANVVVPHVLINSNDKEIGSLLRNGDIVFDNYSFLI